MRGEGGFRANEGRPPISPLPEPRMDSSCLVRNWVTVSNDKDIKVSTLLHVHESFSSIVLTLNLLLCIEDIKNDAWA